MILDKDREMATRLFRLGIIGIQHPSKDLFRCMRLRPKKWKPVARWFLLRWTKRQTSDGLHHAPCCPGNEWSGQELVFQACTCGAARAALAQGQDHG